MSIAGIIGVDPECGVVASISTRNQRNEVLVSSGAELRVSVTSSYSQVKSLTVRADIDLMRFLKKLRSFLSAHRHHEQLALSITAMVLTLPVLVGATSALANPETTFARPFPLEAQIFTVSADVAPIEVTRETYEVIPPPPPPPPPKIYAIAVPDPDGAQAIARRMVAERGWSDAQFQCLLQLWHRESGWRVNAENPSSGAYGIPQALPGSKMGSVADDWRTNATTQITWGLSYIQSRYGDPCGAWSFFQSNNWY
jgi:hypothetical protein